MSEKKGLLPVPSAGVCFTVLTEAPYADRNYIKQQCERMRLVNPVVAQNLTGLCQLYAEKKDYVSVIAASYAGVSTYRLLELEAQQGWKRLPLVGANVNSIMKRACNEAQGYVEKVLERIKEDNPPIYERLEMLMSDLKQCGNAPRAAACGAVALVYASLELQAETDKLYADFNC